MNNADPEPLDQTRLELWFSTEVKCHEGMVRAWLRSRFSSDQDVQDILQDAYLRIWEARKLRPINSPKAYFYATARNLANERFRRNKVLRSVFVDDFDIHSVFDGEEDISEEVAEGEELEILTSAIQHLPRRCRRILTLMKIYGYTQKEVAAELSISVKTVENQCAIGMKKIARFFERYSHETGRRPVK